MAKVVAVVGASEDRTKFGNKALRAFLAAGETVVPIHPRAETIEGLRAYRSVAEVPGPIDMATVYLPPQVTLGLLPGFAARGIPEIWLNPGAEDEAVLAAARALHLNVITACSIVGIGRHPSDY